MNETERFGDLGAQGIGNGNDAEDLAHASFMRRVAEYGEGLALRFDASQDGLDLRAANSGFMGHAVIPDEIWVAADGGPGSLSSGGLIVGHRFEIEIA